MPIARQAGVAPLDCGIGCRPRHSGAPPHGPPRVSGQAAVRQARHRRAEWRGRLDGRGGGRRRGADRLPLRDQGPGADRRPRQGGRDQDRRRRRGGARARRRDPRHGHRRPARRGAVPGRPGLDRGRLRHRRRVLRLGDPRPRREEAAGDGFAPRAGWTSRRSPRRTPRRWSSATSTRPRPSTPPRRAPIVDDAGLDEDVRDAGGRGAGEAGRGRGRRGREPDRGQPADRHRRPRGRRARRQGDDRRQRALPPPGPGRDRRHAPTDPQEAMAKEKGLTYVKLDGNVGILANGAGLCMSTLDVVAQAGGAPANFLDAGGGSKAEAIVDALDRDHLRREGHGDPLQHLRRHHPLRRDRQGHRHRVGADRPRACRWSFASTAPTPRRA